MSFAVCYVLITRFMFLLFVLCLFSCFLRYAFYFVFCVFVLFCVLFLLIQVYWPLPPAANPTAINKYNIISNPVHTECKVSKSKTNQQLPFKGTNRTIWQMFPEIWRHRKFPSTDHRVSRYFTFRYPVGPTSGRPKWTWSGQFHSRNDLQLCLRAVWLQAITVVGQGSSLHLRHNSALHWCQATRFLFYMPNIQYGRKVDG